MPAASCSGLSATTICMVEQFGLAMIPRWASSASGLTSDTTSGTSSCIRQREELSTTTAPAPTKRGAHSPDVAPPAEKIARSKPSMVVVASGWTTMPRSSRPAERSEANGTTSRAGKPRSRRSSSITEPTCAGGADDGDAIALALCATCSPNGRSGRIASSPELERGVQRAHGVRDAVAGDRRRRS